MKAEFKLIFAFSLVFISLSVVALTQTASATPSGTITKTITHSPTDQAITTAAEATGDITEYTSPTFAADFTFTGAGIRWTGSSTAQVAFEINIDDTGWQSAEFVGNDAKNKYEGFVTSPIFQSGKQLQYRITGPDVSLVRQVELVYFDTSQPPATSTLQSIQDYFNRSTQTSTSAVSVISREAWGADESFRTWQTDYTTPTHFIIHHTAGSTGSDDPAATVRGIYYWQAVVLGWGDIGYNYIVDTEGNVYEGRYGGDGAIGAHAYNSDTDINYNEHTIGISVLGCYEATPGACSTVDVITPEVLTSLQQLIGSKANTWQIDPTASADLQGETLATVIGHRDVDYTYCPGDLLYAELGTIRSGSSALYTAAVAYHAKWNYADFSKSYPNSATPSIRVKYTNDGSKTWSADDVVMQVTVPRAHLRQRVALPNDVASRAKTSITFGWSPLPKASHRFAVHTKLYRNGKPIRGSSHTYHVTIK